MGIPVEREWWIDEEGIGYINVGGSTIAKQRSVLKPFTWIVHRHAEERSSGEFVEKLRRLIVPTGESTIGPSPTRSPSS